MRYGARETGAAGSVAIPRSLLEREWYGDTSVVRLFVHLVLKAGAESGRLETSRAELSEQTGLTEQQVRRALLALARTNTITTETTNKSTSVTICNYSDYTNTEPAKEPAKQPAKQPAEQPAEEQPETPKSEVEFIGKITEAPSGQEKKAEKETKHKYGEYKNVLLTDAEAAKLRDQYGDDAVGMAEYLSAYKVEKNYKTKSDYLTIKRWVADAFLKQKNQTYNGNNGTNSRNIQQRAERIADYAFAANGL